MILPLLLVLAQPPTAPVDPPVCRFRVLREAAAPEIVGPPEIVKGTHVVVQADSPLRIVRVNLSSANFRGSGSGVLSFELLNVSDQAVEGGALGFAWGVGSFAPMTGAATFSNTVAPSGSIQIEARLPGTDTPGDTTMTSVVISVRSANLAGCTYEPAQAVPRSIYARPLGVKGVPDAEACPIAPPPPASPPKFSGSGDALARLGVLEQPGSPLRITRIDVSKLKVNVGETWLQLRGSYAIEVENVSGMPVESAVVGLLTRARGPAGGGGLKWAGTLAPGKSVELRDTVARIDDYPPGGTAADVRLLGVVDRVLFEHCNYQPARVLPRR